MDGSPDGVDAALPYKLACLCDLRDAAGRVLLIHRERAPNKGLCSPIGGKLDVASGESPAACAQREIEEEAGITVPLERLHLSGIISERAFEGRGHWLLFYFRVLGAVEVAEQQIPEGRLAWHEPAEIPGLPIPATDREIIWPIVNAHDEAARVDNTGKPGFFSVHIDCRDGAMTWRVEQARASVPGVIGPG
ncbi:MAG: NUDIX domain-containing protein [Planctomycetota bacterium]